MSWSCLDLPRSNGVRYHNGGSCLPQIDIFPLNTQLKSKWLSFYDSYILLFRIFWSEWFHKVNSYVGDCSFRTLSYLVVYLKFNNFGKAFVIIFDFAILILIDVDCRFIPCLLMVNGAISIVTNVIVVGGGSYSFAWVCKFDNRPVSVSSCGMHTSSELNNVILNPVCDIDVI